MPRPAEQPRHPPPTRPRALTEHEVAEITGFTCRTLQDRRHRRLGPPYRKLGRKAVYIEHEVVAWLDAQVVGGTRAG